MPGTIQVSVLEFMGLPSSSPPSSISLKVSMGKREYQTWDKGDFSFPLTTLRENLIVTLQDDEGNEISHTGVETMSIVEKGFWDDLFPLEGGGHVHMKLQFILSEEERNRIRIMRESALKKKHDKLLSSSLRCSETASTVDKNVALSLCGVNHEVSDSQERPTHIEAVSIGEVATQAVPISNPVTFCKDPQYITGNKEGAPLDQKHMTPNDTDGSEETSSTAPESQGVEVHHLTEVNHRNLIEMIKTPSPPAGAPSKPILSQEASSILGCPESVVAANNNSISPKLEEDLDDNPKKQSPLEKTPSNVRKMISAFESSQAQDRRPRTNLPTTKSQTSKIATEAPLKNPRLKEVKNETTKPEQLSSGRVTNHLLTTELQHTPTDIQKRGEQIGFDRAFDGTKSSQDTGQLKESSAKHIHSKGTNSSLKNKFKVAHNKVDTKEERKSLEDLMRTSTVETATVSGRLIDGHSGTNRPGNLLTNCRDSGGTSVIEESGRRICSKDSYEISIREVSNDKVKSVAYCEDEHYLFESSGTWIFPDEARRLCITTGGKQVMDLMVGCGIEAKAHQGETSLSKPENVEENSVHSSTDIEVNKGEKTSHKPRKSKLEASADVETSRGPVGQAIKVAIMVGFGTLVLLTRQRKNR